MNEPIKSEEIEFEITSDSSTGGLDARDRINYELNRQLLQKNWISLWGEIEPIICENTGLFLLNACMSGIKKATIFICSCGGSEDDARALMSIMEFCKSRGMIIRVYGAGLVASAAFDIFITGSKGYRFVNEFTMFMTHSSSIETRDKSLVRLQDYLDEHSLQTYTKIHKKTRERYLETGNWYFSPDEGLKFGACDAVIKAGDILPDSIVIPKPVEPKNVVYDPMTGLSVENVD